MSGAVPVPDGVGGIGVWMLLLEKVVVMLRDYVRDRWVSFSSAFFIITNLTFHSPDTSQNSRLLFISWEIWDLPVSSRCTRS